MYFQEWSAEMNTKKSCEMYRVIKTDFGLENYLMQLSYYQRSSLSKFRCRYNRLPVTFGRDVNVLVDEMLCPFCENDVIGDEYHYLFMCDTFKEDWNKLIDEKWIVNPQQHFLSEIFQNNNTTELRNLASFIDIVVSTFDNIDLHVLDIHEIL